MGKIVWLVSYPKSGNTWFRMFLANLLQDSTTPVDLKDIENTIISSSASEFEEEIGLNPFELTPDEVDQYRPTYYQSIARRENRPIIYKKTHDAYTLNSLNEPIFPSEISQCAIYFVRNPLDVCISYSNHNAAKVESMVKFILKENGQIAGQRSGQLRQKLLSWKSHYSSWCQQKEIPLMLVRYEDMLQQPMMTFSSIVRFLGLPHSDEQISRAIINSDFKLLKQMEEENGFQERLQQCKSFFWKGMVGNYKEFLTQEQISEIVNYNHREMRELGYIDKNEKLTV